MTTGPSDMASLEACIAELAPLASQHHASDYNRLKFGVKGCPNKYFPLSLHVPDFFSKLQHRQAQGASAKAWWPCDTGYPPPKSPLILGSRGAQPNDLDESHLQQDIQDAMAEPLDLLPPSFLGVQSSPSTILKTSSSHPINISFVIPPELIPLISSHLLYVAPSALSPTIFELSQPFTLDNLLTLSPPHWQAHSITHPPPFPPQMMTQHFRTRTKVTEALRNAMTGSLSPIGILDNLQAASPSHIHSTAPMQIPRSASADYMQQNRNLLMKHSNTSSISLTLSLTIADTSPVTSSIKRSTTYPIPYFNRDGTYHTEASTHPPIGNLLLSSCPGKKVRLQGPVRGRSGVCRDLNIDLKRIKGLGVGCIICCLDDEELDYLGAPWPEYEKIAKLNGIDILRIPTPEGLAPISPSSFDDELIKLINAYTLRGIPVLVHCRGGVGRAGVIACCWLIRLGLCGWIGSDNSTTTNDTMKPKRSRPDIRNDMIDFVGKVISVIRRRRSLKAIETYEQVQFLFDFIEHLWKQQVH